MIRSGHVLYDLRELFGSARLLILLLILGGAAVYFVSFQCVYPLALLLAAAFAVRGLIGRRCPQCDGPLKESESVRDPTDAFALLVTWRCPRDGYEEKEQVKGSGGLFGSG